MRASEGLQAGISAPSSPSTTLGESNQETWNGTDFSSSKSTFINTFMRRKSLWLARIVVVQLITHVRLFVTPWTATHQASCPSLSPGVCSNLCPFNWWCHPSISSSVDPFSSYRQSFPVSGSFPASQLFVSSGQNIGTSASVSVLSMNTQGWIPLGLTSLISLQSKGLSRVFSNTMV